eukprot:741845_1
MICVLYTAYITTVLPLYYSPCIPLNPMNHNISFIPFPNANYIIAQPPVNITIPIIPTTSNKRPDNSFLIQKKKPHQVQIDPRTDHELTMLMKSISKYDKT